MILARKLFNIYVLKCFSELDKISRKLSIRTMNHYKSNYNYARALNSYLYVFFTSYTMYFLTSHAMKNADRTTDR